MSIPAVTGFEYGLGFRAASMKGSEANDEIVSESGEIKWKDNLSGGILGGITTGERIVIRCSFKPTSSIRKPQGTVDLRTGEKLQSRLREDMILQLQSEELQLQSPWLL